MKRSVKFAGSQKAQEGYVLCTNYIKKMLNILRCHHPNDLLFQQDVASCHTFLNEERAQSAPNQCSFFFILCQPRKE